MAPVRRLPPFAGLRHSYRCDPKGGASEMTANCQNPPVLEGIDLVALSRAGAAELGADAGLRTRPIIRSQDMSAASAATRRRRIQWNFPHPTPVRGGGKHAQTGVQFQINYLDVREPSLEPRPCDAGVLRNIYTPVIADIKDVRCEPRIHCDGISRQIRQSAVRVRIAAADIRPGLTTVIRPK